MTLVEVGESKVGAAALLCSKPLEVFMMPEKGHLLPLVEAVSELLLALV